MANRQARSPGAIQDFEGRGRLTRDTVSQVTGGDEAFRALMQVSSGLSATFGQMADRAAAREGEAAGEIAGQAAAAQVDDDSFAVSPPKPLALRRDGTIRGEAFDRAASAASGWRNDLALTTGIARAYEENAENPEGLDTALGQLRATFMQGVTDPAIEEKLDKAFAERSITYRLKAQSDAETRANNEMKATGRAALDEKIGAFGKQLYMLGANPEGEGIAAGLMKQGTTAIQQAVQDGVISPDEGNRLVAEYGNAAVTSRMAGVFDALPDGKARLAFASGLKDTWANDKGALGKVDAGAVDRLQQQLLVKARHEMSGEDRVSRTEANAMRQAVQDDVASIMASGEPLATGLTFEQVQATLGEANAVEWQNKTENARLYYATTGDMDQLTAEQIADRVTEVAPEPGSEGFAEREQLYSQVHRQATRVLQDRLRDPAQAVTSFKPVADAQANLQPGDPASWNALISARLAAQGALDIPGQYQKPLTQAEVQEYGKAVLGVEVDANSLTMLQDFGRHLEARFGTHADEVMTQILTMQGVDRDVAKVGNAVMKRLNIGQQPTGSQQQSLETASEAAAADQAMTGQGPAANAGQTDAIFPRPNARAIDRLVQNPGMSAMFDQAFGPGQAEFYLARHKQPVAPPQGTPQGSVEVPEEGGTTTLNPDGSEDWRPNE